MKKKRRNMQHSRSQVGRDFSVSDANANKFGRLMQAIIDVPDTAKHRELSHDECQELLGYCVDLEKHGEVARDLYPSVYAHLKACGQCRMSYDLLTEAVSQPMSHDFPLPVETKIELPFLIKSIPNAVWSRQNQPPTASAPLSFGFTLSPAVAASALTQSSQFALRGEFATGKSLLLSDSIVLGSRNIAVELWLHPSDKPDYARIEISVVASSPLPEPLRAKIRCNNREYSTQIEHDHGWIDSVAISDLGNADLSVQFEAGSPSTTHQDLHDPHR